MSGSTPDDFRQKIYANVDKYKNENKNKQKVNDTKLHLMNRIEAKTIVRFKIHHC